MNKGLGQGNVVPPAYEELVRPHVDSFDFFLAEGIHQVVALLEPTEVRFACQSCSSFAY